MKIDQLISHSNHPIISPVGQRYRCVHVDGSTNRIARNRWRWFWEKQFYYAVAEADDSNQAGVARRTPFRVPITPGDTEAPRVELELFYSVWCLPGNVERFAVWFHDRFRDASGPRLESLLDDKLRQSADGIVAGLRSEQCADFSVLRKQLTKCLKEACAELEYDVQIVRPAHMLQTWETVEPLEMSVKFDDYDDHVIVQTKVLQLSLIDFRRNLYHGSRHSDLPGWARAAVSEARSQIATGSYTKFITDWYAVREKIRQRVIESAARIGYQVVALLHEPSTREYEALRELKVEVENADFKTKDANVTVQLSMYVVGRLRNLQKPVVKAAVRSKGDIVKSLEGSLVTAVQSEMHAITANDFYHNFIIAPALPENSKSVQERLQGRMMEVLKMYDVIGLAETGEEDSATVVVKQGESDVTSAVRALMGTPIIIRELEIAIAGTGHTTPYNFTFTVRGINGSVDGAYARLASLVPPSLRGGAVAPVTADAERQPGARRGTADETVRFQIVDAIQELLLARLHTLGQQNVQYTEAQRLHLIEEGVREMVLKFAATEFGLEIHLQTIRRHATLAEQQENEFNQAQSDHAIATLKKGLEKIAEGQAKYLTNQVDALDHTALEGDHLERVKESEKFVEQRKKTSLPDAGAAQQDIKLALLGGSEPKKPGAPGNN